MCGVRKGSVAVAGTASVEERVERLKGLLTGRSPSARAARALSREDGYGNLLLGVALHGADGRRQGRALTDLEGLLVDALGTIMDEAELKAWGAAYRETVQSAAPGTLIVPKVVSDLPAAAGFAVADLERVLPQLSAEVAKAPNVCLLSLEDLATGREVEDPEFIEGMQACGFAVTGIARHPGAGAARPADTTGGGGEALASWRVRLEMEEFHVVRAVGDQGGGRDEIYFTASSSVGGGRGQTFVSEEFGAVKRGQTRSFTADKKVFLDQDAGPSGLVVSSVQVWEADQSSSRWYDALQKSLNIAVEEIDTLLNNPIGMIVDPTPLPVTIAYEVAKVFIALMDTLRNTDDLSCSATFVLTRDDMAVLHHQPELTWHFNGDGHHKLTVRYTGARPLYPTGSIEIVSRTHGTHPSLAGEWSAPIPLGWKTTTAPAITALGSHVYAVFSRAGDNMLMWSRYDGAAWTTPLTISSTAASDRPSALAVHNNRLHLMFTGGDSRIRHAWFNGGKWSRFQTVGTWESPFGPSLTELDGVLWSAHTGLDNHLHLSAYVADTWNTPTVLDDSFGANSGPALGTYLGSLTVHHRLRDDRVVYRYSSTPGQSPGGWSTTVRDDWRTRSALTEHRAGRDTWLAHRGTDGRPNLAWRDAGAARHTDWSSAEIIDREGWTCTTLAAPVLTTHNGRTYAIYHA